MLGHDRGDQLRRRHVERRVARGEARRHLGRVALLDRDLRAARASRGRRSSSARRRRTGSRGGARSTASPYVPILFAVSPLAAIRSAPVNTASTSPAAISDAAAESAITACGIAGGLELPRGQPRALEQRPRLVDPDVLEQAALPRREQRADRAAVAAGREAARVAVRQRARARARAARPRARPSRRQRSTSSRWIAARVLGRRVVAHLVERPAEVDRRRPRLAQHALGLRRGPRRARPRARSRRRRRCRSRARRAPPSSGSPRRPRPPCGTRPRPPRAAAGAGRGRRRGRPRGAGSAQARANVTPPRVGYGPGAATWHDEQPVRREVAGTSSCRRRRLRRAA